MKLVLPGLKWAPLCLATLVVVTAAGSARAQYGVVLSGTGAVTRSFGGVATAAPLSPGGALYWNPATMPGLGRSELEADAELLFPHTAVASSVSPGALGPGIPPVGLAGRTDSDTGAFALPTIGLVYLPEDSPLGFGLGVFAQAGFGVDYAGSNSNPLLTAPPPHGIGFGPVYSDYQVLQIVAAASYRLTDRLSVAAGPTLDLSTLRVDPAIFAAPDDANGDGFATYPRGTHGQTTWGGGFVVGAYYQADTWAAGASVKSPQWFDKFRSNSSDELGRPRTLSFDLDDPMIVSVGAAYRGLERWVLATDVRYIDYADANGFGRGGFSPDGALRGVGWRSIVTVAAGVQYQLTPDVSLRLGYSWNENPIPNAQAFVNTLAPTITEHMLTAGVSWKVTDDFTLSVAYMHAFDNAIGGSLVTPAGQVPGTFVQNSASGDVVVVGASLKY